MLARYLRERERPVRYASPYHDPESLQALMNFLAISTRAGGLPNLHRGEMRAPGANRLASMYQQNPASLQAINSLFQNHHPADLAAYLDMADEYGIPHMRGSSDPGYVQFIQTLRDLYDEMTHGGGEQGVNPHILRQYGGGLQNPVTLAAVQRGVHLPTGSMTPAQRVSELLRSLVQHRDRRASDTDLHNQSLRQYNNPLSLVHLHDIADDVLHDDKLPASVGNWGAGVRADMSDLLHRVVQPTLRGL